MLTPLLKRTLNFLDTYTWNLIARVNKEQTLKTYKLVVYTLMKIKFELYKIFVLFFLDVEKTRNKNIQTSFRSTTITAFKYEIIKRSK